MHVRIEYVHEIDQSQSLLHCLKYFYSHSLDMNFIESMRFSSFFKSLLCKKFPDVNKRKNRLWHLNKREKGF